MLLAADWRQSQGTQSQPSWERRREVEGDSSLLTQLTSIHLPPTSQTWTHWSNSPHHKLLKIFQFYFFNSCERVLLVCQLILQMMLRGNESVKLSPIRRRLMISPSAGMGQAVHCSKPPRLTPPSPLLRWLRWSSESGRYRTWQEPTDPWIVNQSVSTHRNTNTTRYCPRHPRSRLPRPSRYYKIKY